MTEGRTEEPFPDLVPEVDGAPGGPVRAARRRTGAGTQGGVVLAPSREDPLVGALSAVAGGPAGHRLASSTSFWSAVTVLVLLSAAVMGLGVATKQHCRAEGWSTPDQFWHLCYSDVPALYASADLGAAGLPDALAALGQPPVAGTAMWLLAQLVPGGDVQERTLWFFDASAIALALALAAAVAALALAGGRRAWDAAHLALAPVVVVSALVSYDLLAVAFLACALLAWVRRRPAVAGVLLGLAVATRPLYAVLAVAFLVLGARTGSWRPVTRLLATAVSVWAVLRVVLLPGWTGGLGQGWDTWRGAGAGFGSLWLLPDLVSRSRPRATRWWYDGGALSASSVTLLTVVALGTLLLSTVLVGLSARHRPRLAHLALLLVAGTILVGKSVPPQAALLLLPFVAMAGLRWRDHLVWATAELSYFVGVWLYIAAQTTPDRGLTPAFYGILLLVRAAGLVYLMVLAVRAMRNPVRDPVRVPREGDGADDPHGGELDGVPDALVVRVV